MSMTMARLAVERGAKMLDRFFTASDGIREDWEHYIDLDELGMFSPNRCIIGQLSPVISEPEDKSAADYRSALKALDAKLGTEVYVSEDSYVLWAERHGFESSINITWEQLEAAWNDEIQGRLERLEKA